MDIERLREQRRIANEQGRVLETRRLDNLIAASEKWSPRWQRWTKENQNAKEMGR